MFWGFLSSTNTDHRCVVLPTFYSQHPEAFTGGGAIFDQPPTPHLDH